MTQIFIKTTLITLNLTEFSIRIELFFTENVTPNFAAVKMSYHFLTPENLLCGQSSY
jgi:hypothetical protein